MLGRTKGFSLIELLVVIAILSLLMAMLAPSLLRARQAARTVVSSTNLHVIGQTAHLYAADNNNFVPRDAWYGADYGTPGDGSNSPSPGTRAGNTCRSSRSNAWRSGRRSCGHLPAPPLCAGPRRTCDVDPPSSPARLFSCQSDPATALSGRGNHRSDAARESLTHYTTIRPKASALSIVASAVQTRRWGCPRRPPPPVGRVEELDRTY